MSRTLDLSTNAFSSKVFRPVKLSGIEKINELFTYQLTLKTPDLNNFEFFKQHGMENITSAVDITSWIGQAVVVRIELLGKGIRYLSGIISAAQYLYQQRESNFYSIEFKPFLAQATLRSDYKIFQDLTVIEIIDQILSPYSGVIEKQLNLDSKTRYPKRNYQTQFGETDFQFFSRLCSEWGINYYFTHNEAGHTLVLSDESDKYDLMPNTAYQCLNYFPPNHFSTDKEEYVRNINLTAQMVSGAFASSDYDYLNSTYNIIDEQNNIQPYSESAQKGKLTNPDRTESDEVALSQHQIYEYSADITQAEVDLNEGKTNNNQNYNEEHISRDQWNLERIQQQHFKAHAAGHLRGIACGHIFQLEKHPNALANIRWHVTGTELLVMDLVEESHRKTSGFPSLLVSADNNHGGLSRNFIDSVLGQLNGNLSDKLEKASDSNLNKLDKLLNSEQDWQVECHFDLIPDNISVRPLSIEKPKGFLQNAIVVGDVESDSVYTDLLGRIKVQFYWDRYGQKNQNSSCWVRVNEPWAGNQMGAVFTPRIGQEVLIDYINNDPDLPVCIGKVNNNNNMPNWQLTQNKTLSGFRSRELPSGNSAAGRSNHLVFDDTAGSIQTQLKSDHAHSQLSLGEITRIEDNAGRKDARGQGFELRTDDWGSTRAAKGLYLSTFARKEASSTHMDATEPKDLLQEAKELVERLSKLAEKHEANGLTHAKTLDQYSKAINVDVTGGVNNKSSDTSAPEGFSEALLVGAGEGGIVLVTPEKTQQYSGRTHAITAGEDVSIGAGHSLIASSGKNASIYAQNQAKLIAGQGEICIKADDNNINITADKSVQVTAVNNKVQVTAEKEIMIACGGAYIKLSGGNIYLHAPGVVEQRGVAHPFMSPTSLNIAGPKRNAEKGALELYHLYANKEGTKDSSYKIIDSIGKVITGKLNPQGYAKVTGLNEGAVKTFVSNDNIDPTVLTSQFVQNDNIWPSNPTLNSIVDFALNDLGAFLPEEASDVLGILNKIKNGTPKLPDLANNFAGSAQLVPVKVETNPDGTKKPRPDGTTVLGTNA